MIKGTLLCVLASGLLLSCSNGRPADPGKMAETDKYKKDSTSKSNTHPDNNAAGRDAHSGLPTDGHHQ